mmetsp:Transcript_11301/g.42187  ORF Transcript_11301/g.42187 Transcript_11301/m.42187 type:complete len:213 (+) Transcript_11301:1373-2011(+)
MPPRSSTTPRRIPGDVSIGVFLRLPKREILRIPLLVLLRPFADPATFTGSILDAFHAEARQLPVALLLPHFEVHGACLRGVGIAPIDEDLDHVDDVVHVIRRPRHLGRHLHVERVEVLLEQGLVLAGELDQPHAFLLHPHEDFIIDIRQVQDVRDVHIVAFGQPSLEHVVGEESSEIAHVRKVVHGGAAAVEGRLAGLSEEEGILGPCERVV